MRAAACPYPVRCYLESPALTERNVASSSVVSRGSAFAQLFFILLPWSHFSLLQVFFFRTLLFLESFLEHFVHMVLCKCAVVLIKAGRMKPSPSAAAWQGGKLAGTRSFQRECCSAFEKHPKSGEMFVPEMYSSLCPSLSLSDDRDASVLSD